MAYQILAKDLKCSARIITFNMALLVQKKNFIDSMQRCAFYRVIEELHTTTTETLLDTTKSETQSKEYDNEDKSTESMLSITNTATAQNGVKLEIWVYVSAGVAVVTTLLNILLLVVCAIICIRLRRSKANQYKLYIAKP